MRLLPRALLLAALGVGMASHGLQAQQRENPFAASMVAFQERVKAYISLRDKIAGTLPEVKETNDPAKISAREKALGMAIAMERRTAKAGDVFGDLSPYLQRIIDDDWKKRSAADRKGLFEEIPPGLKLTINQPYPTTIPLITVPGKLLARLPTLPEAVEYRLIERRLLLRDRDANLVVDVLGGVPPARSK
jgi:hypothetical protein